MVFRRLCVLSILMLLGIGTSTVPVANSFPDFNISSDRAQAQNNKNNKGEARGWVLDQLNLSEAQKRQLGEIQQKYENRISQSRNAYKSAKQELENMLLGNESIEALRAKRSEVLRLRKVYSDLRFESKLETREVLNLDQRRQFAQIMEQRTSESSNQKNR